MELHCQGWRVSWGYLTGGGVCTDPKTGNKYTDKSSGYGPIAGMHTYDEIVRVRKDGTVEPNVLKVVGLVLSDSTHALPSTESRGPGAGVILGEAVVSRTISPVKEK